MYEIDRDRYYELKHFCLQYPIWKKRYSELKDGCSKCSDEDPTAKIGQELADYSRAIELVENTAKIAQKGTEIDILAAVTLGQKPKLKACTDEFYYIYRLFFWLLDQEKGL